MRIIPVVLFAVIMLFLSSNLNAFSLEAERGFGTKQKNCAAKQNAAIDSLVAGCLKKGFAVGKCEVKLSVRASKVKKHCKFNYDTCVYWANLYAIDNGLPVMTLNQLVGGCYE